MKQFLSKLYRWLFPQEVTTKTKLLSDVINNHTSGLERFEKSVSQAMKQFRRRRIQVMYKEQNLDHKSAHSIAADYRITLRELVDYYHYFGLLPRPEHRIIIKNYGVDNLISEFENLMETAL